MRFVIIVALLAVVLSGCSTTYSGFFRYESGIDCADEIVVLESLKKVAKDMGLSEPQSEPLKQDGAYVFGRGTFDPVPEAYKKVRGSRDSVLLIYRPHYRSIRITSLNATEETEFISILKYKIGEALKSVSGVEGIRFEESAFKHSILGP